MPFDQILGQSRSLNVMHHMLQSGKIPHAFLFTGIAGIGKHTTALAFAKALNCPHCTADFCGTCSSCSKIENGTHPDIIQIAPEKNVIKIEQVRSLQHSIVFAPVQGPWRVILIDQAESMNKETANCLLKTLEEPPPATVLVLITHAVSRLLPTVVSRCQRLMFAPLARQDLQRLLEQEAMGREEAAFISAHAQGSMHRAHQLLDHSLIDDLGRLTSVLVNPKTVEQRLQLASELSKSPERLTTLLILLLEWLRDAVLCRYGAHTEQLCTLQQAESVRLAACRIHPLALRKKITQVVCLIRDQSHNANMQLGLESLLLS